MSPVWAEVCTGHCCELKDGVKFKTVVLYSFYKRLLSVTFWISPPNVPRDLFILCLEEELQWKTSGHWDCAKLSTLLPSTDMASVQETQQHTHTHARTHAHTRTLVIKVERNRQNDVTSKTWEMVSMVRQAVRQKKDEIFMCKQSAFLFLSTGA